MRARLREWHVWVCGGVGYVPLGRGASRGVLHTRTHTRYPRRGCGTLLCGWVGALLYSGTIEQDEPIKTDPQPLSRARLARRASPPAMCLGKKTAHATGQCEVSRKGV